MDYRNNKVFRSYSEGFYYHSPEDIQKVDHRTVTYSSILDMALDNQANIFILTSNEFYVLFPVQNASCNFSDTTEKLEEYTNRTIDIINEDLCIVRIVNIETNLTLVVTIASLSIGLFGLALAMVAAYKMFVRRFGSKLNTPDLNQEGVAYYEKNGNGTSESQAYETVIYDTHYETVEGEDEI